MAALTALSQPQVGLLGGVVILGVVKFIFLKAQGRAKAAVEREENPKNPTASLSAPISFKKPWAKDGSRNLSTVGALHGRGRQT